MKKIITVLAIVILGSLMVGCGGSKDEEKVVEEQITKIRVATNPMFAPFEFMKDGEIVGFDIDLIDVISRKIGLELEIEVIYFEGLIPALEAEKIDLVIAGMSATDKRKELVNFTTTYYTASQVIVIDKDNQDIPTFDSLNGKKVGVVLGYTGAAMASKIDNITIEKYSAGYAAIIDLKAGKIDAVILDSEPAKGFVRENSWLKLASAVAEKEEYAMAISKENPELLEKVNDALRELKMDGTYDRLLKKWF
ncbi:MAG: basic amino acid ABC transporter substrate-binding protein [Psychrilyobacter sp.]|nr:basic amino acid ABC transporter substrate-binding protein [Psychrilyobacter sp.]